VTAAERWVYDRRDEHLAAVVDVDEEYDRYLTEKARADRERLWRKTPVAACGDCLKPIPAEWSTCISCDAQFDEERRRNER
jgi:hypothetical protein